MEEGRPDAGTGFQSNALLPAAVLLAFALWCGTFAGGASARGAMVAHGILWLGWVGSGVAVARRVDRQIWRATLILALAWWAVASPLALSPVPRAGSSAVALLPTFLILPWLVARCWRDPRRVRWGVLGVAVVIAVVAGRALWGWWLLDTDGAASPLGHHNLLAAFLVTTLPLTAVGWRWPGIFRWLAASSAALGVVALLATRSLSGTVALGAMMVFWFASDRFVRRSNGRRRLAVYGVASLGVAAGLLAVFGRRLLAVAAGIDPSSMARLGYWRAGWGGFLERPWFGWGPGSTPWTIHEHFAPVPGIHPPDQVLADLHSLPLQLLYELGLVGCVLIGIALLWTVRCLRQQPARDPGLARAGWAGLVGAGVVSLAGMPLSVTALPVAVSLAAGAVLAGSGVVGGEAEASSGRPMSAGVAVVIFLAFLIAAASARVVVPRDLAQLAYEQAATAGSGEERIEALRRATALDPSFPLYRWRLALALEDEAMAYEAAAQARSVAALWLSANAWDRVCRLSHFGTMAPFRAGLARPRDVSARARALAAQPWLLAAVSWRDRSQEVDAAVALLVADPRIEVGWRSELQTVWRQISDAAALTMSIQTSIQRLVLEVDDEPATSLSLHTFRRFPWPVRLDEIRLDTRLLGLASELPPASTLPATDPTLFRSAFCAVGLPGP